MLINGRHAEELRVAIVDEKGRLQGYRVAMGEAEVERGNIYRGVVANIEPSLDAAFIEYGAGRHGFLKRHDVVEAAYHIKKKGAAEGQDEEKEKGKSKGRGKGKGGGPAMEQVLQKGQPILVQVTRDAVANKGATMTTNISLAGRYLVLKPYENTRGVSRKVEDEDLRRKLREKVKNLVAGDFGFIVRTNAADQTKTELKGDLDRLKRLWKQALSESTKGRGPRLVYDDQDLVIQVLRDHLDGSVGEILVDDKTLFEHAERYLAAVSPRKKIPLVHYPDRLPLFSKYKLEPQVTAIYRRSVPLPSGGSLVIDHTEALTAIDVNSGRATAGGTQKDTAYNTNLEAAEEVARQLRMRDVGGLVVVDFIDMRTQKHQRALEKTVKEAMKSDRARARASRLSSNGLMEINRQRVGQQLTMRTHVVCDSCQGVGWLPSQDVTALSLLRRVEARAADGRLARARIHLNPRVAQDFQNRRRAEMATLEGTYKLTIEVLGNPDMQPGEERLEWRIRTGPAVLPEDEMPPPSPALTAAPPMEPVEFPEEDEEMEEPEEEEEEEEEEEQRDVVEEQTRSRSSSRRRGGRQRRKKSPKEGNNEMSQDGESKDTEPAQDQAASAEGDSGDAEKSKSSSSRRRRRRRKKKSPSGNGQDPPTSGQNEQPKQEGGGDDKGGTPSPSGRRGRRRRRGGGGAKKARLAESGE